MLPAGRGAVAMRLGVRHRRAKALIHDLLASALRAVDPSVGLLACVRRRGEILTAGGYRFDLRRYRRIVVVGAGKASARMAAAIEEVLGSRLSKGLVVVKYGHAAPTRRVAILEAGHPVPDQAGARAAAAILQCARDLGKDDLLIVLLSGGASSLLPMPAAGLSLQDKQKTTTLLLRSGATIHEVNAVRKHLSALKGGRLAQATRASVLSLILSDVMGDNLEVIGSGPTAPDPTTFQDARAILQRYELWRRLSARVRGHLSAGCRRRLLETPKPGARLFRRVHHVLIGNNSAAVDAATIAVARARVNALTLSTTLTGEAREIAKVFGAMAREIVRRGRPLGRPACVLAGGELTVLVRGKGLGGRAQEFALASALEIAGLRDVWIGACGTDGTDGPTDAAGAIVDGTVLARAARLGMDVGQALDHNDAYPLLKRLDAHIMTGPTGTNVNDLYFLIAL